MTKTKKPDTEIRYEVITQEDPETGDLMIPIPDVVLKQLGWSEGDQIEFEVDDKGTIYLKNIKK